MKFNLFLVDQSWMGPREFVGEFQSLDEVHAYVQKQEELPPEQIYYEKGLTMFAIDEDGTHYHMNGEEADDFNLTLIPDCECKGSVQQ